MKLMITGAGGFVGSRLVSYYAKKYEVSGVSHADLDFTDAERVMEAVGQFCPDVLIHCGAISDVGACEQNPALSMAVNVEGTRNLAAACRKAGARFVFCSSDQVYFGQQEEVSLVPHMENEVLSPRPLYGQHKLLAERAALEEQPDSVILRLTWMYDMLTEREIQGGRRNLATILENALKNQEAVTFSETDNRGVTDVNEVVSRMEQAWQLPAGIYNYGSSNQTNMYETACRILDAFGKDQLVQRGTGSGVRNLTMDTSKAEQNGIRFSDTAEGLIHFLASFQPCKDL